MVPLFASTPETRTIPIDNDPNYANGAATIGLRLSGNLHGKRIQRVHIFEINHFYRFFFLLLFFFSFKMMNFLLTYDFLLVFFSGFFQEDHYDRPPATRIHLQSEFDANTEHVYDEIPLQSSPLSSRRNV